MIKFKIYFSLFLIITVFITRIGGIKCSADSGVSIGVTVIPIGPPTINDFDYSALNLSQPFSDSGSVKGITNESNELAEDSNNSTNVEPVNPTNSSTDNLLKSTDKNLDNNLSEEKDNQGTVKSAKSETSPNWFMNIFNRCANFFKNLFQ